MTVKIHSWSVEAKLNTVYEMYTWHNNFVAFAGWPLYKRRQWGLFCGASDIFGRVSGAFLTEWWRRHLGFSHQVARLAGSLPWGDFPARFRLVNSAISGCFCSRGFPTRPFIYESRRPSGICLKCLLLITDLNQNWNMLTHLSNSPQN
jgi:hypothetical protein